MNLSVPLDLSLSKFATIIPVFSCGSKNSDLDGFCTTATWHGQSLSLPTHGPGSDVAFNAASTAFHRLYAPRFLFNLRNWNVHGEPVLRPRRPLQDLDPVHDQHLDNITFYHILERQRPRSAPGSEARARSHLRPQLSSRSSCWSWRMIADVVALVSLLTLFDVHYQ